MIEPPAKKTSYSESLKATSITGFAQVIQIVIKIINTKVVAILLGPAGMGLIGLLQSTTGLVSTVAGLGLGNAAVRDIALSVSRNDKQQVSHALLTLRRLVWITGSTGVLFCLLAANWLSNMTFGSSAYAPAFRILGFTVLFGQLAAGQMALLQGFRLLKEMAVVSVVGGLASLVFAIPLYYLYGESGIVPALFLLAIVPVLTAWFMVRRIRFEKWPLSLQQLWDTGKPMVALGAATMLSGLVFMLSLWLVRILVQRKFGLDAVGHFQAGWGVTTIYLQMIFQAMSRDYFPRLSAEADNPVAMVRLVNEQLHLALLLATPMLMLAILAAPWIIQLLYSAGFADSVPQLQWLAFGTLFKVLSWPLGFVLLALRKSALFLVTETIGALGFFVFSYLFIGHYGLNGVGLGYTANYILYLLTVLAAATWLIRFKYDARSLQLMAVSVAVLVFIFVCVVFYSNIVLTLIALGVSAFITAFYLYKLNQLTGLFNKLWNRIK